MGANAQTIVPVFTAGQVLTAAQMTQVNTGIPVFATTVTRDAAFGGTGEKTLAQGQYAYIEATSTLQVYTGSAWATVGGGLTYITQATASSVNSVSINNCFSSTYTNYLILFEVTGGSGTGVFTARLRASGTDTSSGYAGERVRGFGTSVAAINDFAGGDEMFLNRIDPTYGSYSFTKLELMRPNVAAPTGGYVASGSTDGDYNVFMTWVAQSGSTQFDGITFITSGTNFSGTIRVYGYQNS